MDGTVIMIAKQNSQLVSIKYVTKFSRITFLQTRDKICAATLETKSIEKIVKWQ